MNLDIQLEEVSKISRKLTLKVPAEEVNRRLDRAFAEVQKTANLKGFRPGQVPLAMIKQNYGHDVRHRLLHDLIDEAYSHAVREKKLKTVGSPKVDVGQHQHGEGAHDHGIEEGKDLQFTATIDIMPEIAVKGYKGIALSRPTVEVTDEQVETVVKGLVDSRAELVPASTGLVLSDGSNSGREARMGDYVDCEFKGVLITDNGPEARPGMDGKRVIELGSKSFIDGFEEQIVGMRGGETKTFRVTFPADYFEKDFSGKQAEFTVTAHEIKEKKLPELTDEFAKEVGYESVLDLRQKARDFLIKDKNDDADRKVRTDLLGQLIEKNPFDVPAALVESQARSLLKELMEDLKRQGYTEELISQTVTPELAQLRTRAESQVRASLLLETVAEKEGIAVSGAEIETEIDNIAKSMRVDRARLVEYYEKNPGRREDLEFRLRQDRAVQFILDAAKMK